MNHTVRRGSLAALGHGVPEPDVHSNASRWAAWGRDKTAVVTGANAGLGFFATFGLAQAGTRVILACRNEDRADVAMKWIQERVPEAQLEYLAFDSADLDSATRLARELRFREIDVLIANAGIIRTSRTRQEGVLGYEKTMATNFLGHARLVGELCGHFRIQPLRLVTLGSISTWLVGIDPENLAMTHEYEPYRAYAQSKAVLQGFGMILDHKLGQLGWPSRSIAVHPGYSISGLSVQIPGVNEPAFAKRVLGRLQAGVAQGKHHGAVAMVEAALNPGLANAKRGVYLGPRFFSKGPVGIVRPAPVTTSRLLAERSWKMFVQANEGVDPLAV